MMCVNDDTHMHPYTLIAHLYSYFEHLPPYTIITTYTAIWQLRVWSPMVYRDSQSLCHMFCLHAVFHATRWPAPDPIELLVIHYLEYVWGKIDNAKRQEVVQLSITYHYWKSLSGFLK